mgnify:CR=1 FL=1
MDFASFLIQVLNSLQYGLLLFLVASGLTLVFGIMGIINLAHGSFYMIGAYLAFVLASLTGNLFAAIALGIPLALLFGAFLEWALFSHLYKRDHLEQVLLTYGLILIFEEVRSLLEQGLPEAQNEMRAVRQAVDDFEFEQALEHLHAVRQLLSRETAE